VKSLRRSPWHLFTEATKFEQVIHSLYLQKATEVFCCSFTLLNSKKETKILSKSSYLSLMPCFAIPTTINYSNDRPSFHYSPQKISWRIDIFFSSSLAHYYRSGASYNQAKITTQPNKSCISYHEKTYRPENSRSILGNSPLLS